MNHRLAITAEDIVTTVIACGGNVNQTARRFQMPGSNFRAFAARRGVDLVAVRAEIRAARPAGDIPSVTGDALPSARPVLAEALVDVAAMGLEVLRVQGELDEANRIIETLTRELEARAA